MKKKELNFYDLLKNISDRFLALILLFLLCPLLIIIGIIIYFNYGRPIFFYHIRPGYLKKPFRILKFRSMYNKYNSKGDLLPEETRLTKFGKFLRNYSLDEIPSLVNILRGEMSFIGPRPLAMEYLPFYSNEQAKRHSVKPGLTGLAQVNGRNETTWEERFNFDCKYVLKKSFLLDLQIILMTIWKLIIKRESNNQILPPFANAKITNKYFHFKYKKVLKIVNRFKVLFIFISYFRTCKK